MKSPLYAVEVEFDNLRLFVLLLLIQILILLPPAVIFAPNLLYGFLIWGSALALLALFTALLVQSQKCTITEEEVSMSITATECCRASRFLLDDIEEIKLGTSCLDQTLQFKRKSISGCGSSYTLHYVKNSHQIVAFLKDRRPHLFIQEEGV
jgi:hypothetical protein